MLRLCVFILSILCVHAIIPIKLKIEHLEQKLNTPSVSKSELSVVNSRVLQGCAYITFSTLLTVGSQTFRVLVDTGSTTVGIASDQCDDSCDYLSPKYTPGVTAVQYGQTIHSQYGSGSWTGRVYSDEVSLGGFGSTRLIFAAIDSSTTFFVKSHCRLTYNSRNQYQGILGLAYPSIAVSPTQSYLDQINLSPNIFAIQMCVHTGQLWLGGFDEAYFNPTTLQYTPITLERWYVVDLTSIRVDGDQLAGSDSLTIVDSGTTGLILKNDAFDAVTGQITQNGLFSSYFGESFFNLPFCRSVNLVLDFDSLLPILSIHLGGDVILTLKPIQSYLLLRYDENGDLYFCPGIFRGGTTILGYSVMNQYVTIFDRSSKRIGFAESQRCDELLTNEFVNYTAWHASTWSSECLNCTRTRVVTCEDPLTGEPRDPGQCESQTEPSSSEDCCLSSNNDDNTNAYIAIGIVSFCVLAALLFAIIMIACDYKCRL